MQRAAEMLPINKVISSSFSKEKLNVHRPTMQFSETLLIFCFQKVDQTHSRFGDIEGSTHWRRCAIQELDSKTNLE